MQQKAVLQNECATQGCTTQKGSGEGGGALDLLPIHLTWETTERCGKRYATETQSNTICIKNKERYATKTKKNDTPKNRVEVGDSLGLVPVLLVRRLRRHVPRNELPSRDIGCMLSVEY